MLATNASIPNLIVTQLHAVSTLDLSNCTYKDLHNYGKLITTSLQMTCNTS